MSIFNGRINYELIESKIKFAYSYITQNHLCSTFTFLFSLFPCVYTMTWLLLVSYYLSAFIKSISFQFLLLLLKYFVSISSSTFKLC